MARNFIIQFIGREGSSAIISALSAQKGVNVPLFEDLDEYVYLREHTHDDYPQTLDEVFKTRSFAGDPDRQKYLHKHSPDDEIITTGFKWRVAGHIPDIAKVLLKHNVTIFALQRRSFLNYTCSNYVHRHGNELQSEIDIPIHPHLDIDRGSADGSDPAHREKLNLQSFSLDKRLFLETAKNAVKIKQVQAVKSRRFTRAGVPVKVMFYEDFDENTEAFITRTLAEVGHDITGGYTPFCGFEKVHKLPLHERIIGLEKATESWRYKRFEKEYHAAIKTIEALPVL